MRSASDTDDDHLTDAADAAVDLDMLPELIGYALRRAQLAVFQDFHDSCAAEDIRTAQYAVLHLLRRNPGARQGQVGAALGIKRTAWWRHTRRGWSRASAPTASDSCSGCCACSPIRPLSPYQPASFSMEMTSGDFGSA